MPDAPELPEPEEEASTEDQPPPKQPQLKEEVSISGGRRRGKRQVMKKKTVKDEEGYLGELSSLRLRGLFNPSCSDRGGTHMGVLLGG